jgi:hypothetical protein
MAAFIVLTRERTRNPGELAIYADKAPAGLTGHPITIRAMYGRHDAHTSTIAITDVDLERTMHDLETAHEALCTGNTA